MVPMKRVMDFEEWFKTLDSTDQARILADFANELYPAFITTALHEQMENSNPDRSPETPGVRVDSINNVKSSWNQSFRGCALAEQRLKYADDLQSKIYLTRKEILKKTDGKGV